MNVITLPQRGSARPSGAAGGFGNLQALSLAGGFRGQFQGKTSRGKEGRAAAGMRRWARWSAVSQGEGAARPGDRQPRSQGSGPALPGRRHSPSRPAVASLHTGLQCCCIRRGGSCSYTSPWLLGLSCLGPVPRPRSRHPARGCDSILDRPPQEKGSAWPLGPWDMVDGPI